MKHSCLLKRCCFFLLRKTSRLWPDSLYVRVRWFLEMEGALNLKHPLTFQEKIQWLKLYGRKPQYTTMVDKYAVKEFVASKIGEEYIIPTIAVWPTPEEIDWDSLPNQFVLKATHGGGSKGVVICKDKTTFDKAAAVQSLKKAMQRNIYYSLREWPYKNVKKQIIAEKFMSPKNASSDSDLSDYKFYCFDGEPMYCQVIRDRNTKETIDFYDMNWNHQSFVGLNPIANNGIQPVMRPAHLDVMIEICRKLSWGIPFVRVDLYVIDDKVYFGETTFYPASGYGVFRPEEYNTFMGNLLNIDKLNEQ